MNEHLKNLNQKYVFAYILNYQPPVSSNDTGIMTIVDNSENNVVSLLSQYGFYIDNIFVAGGYGFRSLEELQTAKDVTSNFEEFTYTLNQNLSKIQSKKTIFAFKGTETSEIGSEVTNLNVLSPEYNSYNFITSYQYFNVDEENVFGSLDYKYTLSIKTQSNIKYIENITIASNNGTDINGNEIESIEIEDLESTNPYQYPYKINLTIEQHTSNNILQYNDNLKLYLYSTLGDESYKQTPISLTNSTTQTKEILFYKPNEEFNDNLVLEIRKPGREENTEEVVYSYMIPNFLKWEDKFVIYPANGEIINDMYNIYNFRSINTDMSNQECYNTYKTLVDDNFNETNYINADTNNELFLNFSSNAPCYDYIIFRNLYDLEFYFNGLQSRNWQYKNIMINDKPYYIWQSPQKYIGNHTWKIKINMQ